MMRTPATAPTLEMTFRGHRQGILAVDIQPTQTTKQSSYTRREGATSARKPSSPSTAPPPKILSGGADGAVLLWDASPTTRALRFLGHRGPINTVAFSTKTSIVASGGQDGYARLWLPNLRRSTSSFPSTMSSQIDSSDEEHCCAWRAHGGATRAMAFANDGSDHLFTAGDDKAVKMWDLNHLSLGRGVGGDGHTNRFVGSFSAPSGVRGGGHTNWVRCIAVPAARVASSYQHLVASGGDDQCVHVWDIRTRQVAHTFYDATGSVQAMAFHPDGYSVAAGDAGGSINVYDLRSGYGTSSSTNNSSNMRMPRYGLIQHYANAHLGGVNCIDIDPSGGWLLSAGQDGALRLWDINEGFLFCTMEGHDGAVRSCRISDDGRFFASGGRDKVVMLWRSGLVERSQASRVTKASSGVARISATPAEESQRRLHAGSVAPAPPRTSSLPQPTPVGLPPMMKAGTPPRGAHVDVWAAGRSRSFERSEERLEPQGRSTSAGSSSANAADHPNNNVLFAVRDDDIALIQQQQLLEEEREQEMLVSRERAYQQQQQQQEQESSGSIHRLEALETALTTLSQYIRDQQHAQRDELHSLRSDMQVLEAARSKEIDSMHALLKHLAEMRAPGLMSTTTDDATTAEC